MPLRFANAFPYGVEQLVQRVDLRTLLNDLLQVGLALLTDLVNVVDFLLDGAHRVSMRNDGLHLPLDAIFQGLELGDPLLRRGNPFVGECQLGMSLIELHKLQIDLA